MNDVGAEVEAIESTLGTNPHHSTSRSVNYGSVDARLEAIETDYTQGGHSHDHGALSGLGDDDHPQYLLKALGTAKGDLIGYSASGTPIRIGVGSDGQVLTAASGQTPGLQWATPDSGVTDHGALTGLADDDHTQYLLASGARTVGGRFNWNYNGLHSVGLGRFAEDRKRITATTSTTQLDWATPVMEVVLQTNTTFTFPTPFSFGNAADFNADGTTDYPALAMTLFLRQDATGGRTVTWPTVEWVGGTVPTISSVASAVDVFTFLRTRNAGNTAFEFYGFIAGQDMK